MTTLTQPRQFQHGAINQPPRSLLAVLRRFANSWDAYRAAGRVRRDNAAADWQMWNAALADPRIMAEIERARSQQDG